MCLFQGWSTLRSLQDTWPHGNNTSHGHQLKPLAHDSLTRHTRREVTRKQRQTHLANLQHRCKLTNEHNSQKNKHSKQNYGHQKSNTGDTNMKPTSPNEHNSSHKKRNTNSAGQRSRVIHDNASHFNDANRHITCAYARSRTFAST